MIVVSLLTGAMLVARPSTFFSSITTSDSTRSDSLSFQIFILRLKAHHGPGPQVRITSQEKIRFKEVVFKTIERDSQNLKRYISGPEFGHFI